MFTCTSYKIVHKIASFVDGNLIKECVMEGENNVCPEKAALFGTISRSTSNIYAES